MTILDIIEKKKNNQKLSVEEIQYFVKEYTNENIPDYQMSALLMAIVINGMDEEEVTTLTVAMTNSGDKMDLNMFQNNTVDKHSTGGIGDKVTLIIAPVVASLGGKVAKMSGKSLGYTGGTIDKLQSIPGFKVEMSEQQFLQQVKNINIAIISQTKNIAPADKKIYALRDVSGTVESIPLIASSIMSKKVASGAKNLVLDVKVGTGAFMKNLSDAETLAKTMVQIGKKCNINTIAILTNMNKPLGYHIGNHLEVEEAMAVLQNKGPKDLTEVSLCIAAYMVQLVKNISIEESKKLVIEILENGKAFEKFQEFICSQGGDLEKFSLEKPLYECAIISNRSGYITHMNSEEIGKISTLLGAGRIHKEDKIDYSAGIVLHKKLGDYVQENDLLATFYSSTVKDFDSLKKMYVKALEIDKIKIFDDNNIYKIID